MAQPHNRHCDHDGLHIKHLRYALLATALLLTGCTGLRGPALSERVSPERGTYVLLNPATVIQDQWEHMPLKWKTEYRLVHLDGRLAIRAVGRQSASGLIRYVHVDPSRCPILEWTWRVEELQAGANLYIKEADDVAASLFLLFGDPGFVSNPDPVPTLRYVWTNDRVAENAVIDNPYMPGIVRNIVVRTGTEHMGEWVTERRNIVADFKRAFGEEPTNAIEAFALFTDNDQTKEPVEAYYADARLLCTRNAEAMWP